MSKMNRRDYLLQMGAGAAAIAGMAGKVFAAQQGRRRHRRPIRKASQTKHELTVSATGLQQFADWPATTVMPSLDAPVTLVFDGLMGFFYDGTCDVRYHPGKRHKPTVQYWDKTSGGCTTAVDLSSKLANCDRMVVEIKSSNSTVNSMVNFYENDPTTPFTDRKTGDERDFRWLLDLNSEDFYANYDFEVQKKFYLNLKVRHGTLYTRMISNSTFLRVNVGDEGNNPLFMGRMPMLMAAALKPDPKKEFVSLQFQELKQHQFHIYYEKTFTPDQTIQIDFLNRCHDCPEPKPGSTHEEQRNDFHYLRKVLDLHDVPEYGIRLEQQISGTYKNPPCGFDGAQAAISDPAPCMGTGFGGR